MNSKIDFVLLWVDGNDENWIREKEKYQPAIQSDTRVQRYRDWENLQYWFRGVEQFTPWVHKIYFVTWGHIPKWLNTNHPKIEIVKHSDFIPEEYLPTFNCNPIELNLHRIKGLSEQFVYFNDDTFVISPMKEDDFFHKGLPRDTAALNVHCLDVNFGFNYADYQAIGITNKYFDFHKTLRTNWKKWFSIRNGKNVLRTLYLLPCPRFPGIYQPHLPNSFLKTTYEELWEKEYDALDETSRNKYRGKLDYTQWVMRNWQLASGHFFPRNAKIGRSFLLEKNKDSVDNVVDYIKNQKGKMIAINDGEMEYEEFLIYRDKIIDAFKSILNKKSSFEKG